MTQLERVMEVIERARDAITVRRVYGDPVERDGTVVIPAADVRGGAGGGGGSGGTVEDGGGGGGGGFGLKARPVGAFVIRNGDVRWEPVVDHERQLVIMATIAGIALLTVRRLTRRKRR